MGIGNITSTNNLSDMQMTMARSTDSKSKNIQNEITDAQQQMQKLSSKEELSVNEKANERKKLQKEISSLNTELKQHQEELLKSQKREIMMAELQADGAKEETTAEKGKKDTDSGRNSDTELSRKEMSPPSSADTSIQQAGPRSSVISENTDGLVILKEETGQAANRGTAADAKQENGISSGKAGEKALSAGGLQADETREEAAAEKDRKNTGSEINTNTGLSHKEMHALVSSDNSVQQANRQGTVIARIRDGIAILKEEINQDEERGVNTDKKQEELEKLEKKEQRARIAQFSVLGDANNAMKPTANTEVSEAKGSTQVNAGNNAFISAINLSNEEDQMLQQQFYVSFTH